MKTICIITTLLFSTTLFSKSLGEAKVSSAATSYCETQIKSSAFYNTIRTSSKGRYYNYDSIDHNRFAKIDEEIVQKLNEDCGKGTSMEAITRTLEMACERSCNKHMDSFKQEIYLKNYADKKSKEDFQDDCLDTCSSVKNQMIAFVEGYNSKSDSVNCNKDAISNSARLIKAIDMDVRSDSLSKGVKQK